MPESRPSRTQQRDGWASKPSGLARRIERIRKSSAIRQGFLPGSAGRARRGEGGSVIIVSVTVGGHELLFPGALR